MVHKPLSKEAKEARAHFMIMIGGLVLFGIGLGYGSGVIYLAKKVHRVGGTAKETYTAHRSKLLTAEVPRTVSTDSNTSKVKEASALAADTSLHEHQELVPPKINVCSPLVIDPVALGLPCMNATNYVDQSRAYCHHPIMWRFTDSFPLLTEKVVEETGLIVPKDYDCKPWAQSVDDFSRSRPSRFLRCREQNKALEDGKKTVQVGPPVIDEEYLQRIAIYQAVLSAPAAGSGTTAARDFVMADVGARWGTAAARAARFLRKYRHDLEPRLLLVEPEASLDSAMQVAAINHMHDVAFEKGKASWQNLAAWMAKYDHVDLLFMDCAGCELDVLKQLAAGLDEKVYRVVVVPETPAIQASLTALFSNELQWGAPVVTAEQGEGHCTGVAYREGNLEEVRRQRCTTPTPYGPVVHFRGLLIYDNPKFQEARAAANAAAPHHCNVEVTKHPAPWERGAQKGQQGQPAGDQAAGAA